MLGSAGVMPRLLGARWGSIDRAQGYPKPVRWGRCGISRGAEEVLLMSFRTTPVARALVTTLPLLLVPLCYRAIARRLLSRLTWLPGRPT